MSYVEDDNSDCQPLTTTTMCSSNLDKKLVLNRFVELVTIKVLHREWSTLTCPKAGRANFQH